ncbi:MAG: hypothetical protein JST54_03835 [Deltaproteobacteria bacterium]|nr:hypothetical protein [Deltaproteobacteria bacterium]
MRRILFSMLLALAACGKSEPLFPRLPPPVDGGLVDAGREIDAGEPVDGGYDAGFPVLPCTDDPICGDGFHCESGYCTLNGDEGDLQITLRWANLPRTPEDLDLHLVEPAPNGPCEIWYGDTNRSLPSSCGALGSLDLDANAACTTPFATGLGEDTENIIYPPNTPPPLGHYTVRVDYYENCTAAEAVPYTVAIRKGKQYTVYQGVFLAGQADLGVEGSGRTIAEFDEP